MAGPLNQDHGQKVIDPIDIEGRSQASFSTSAVAAQSASLDEGIYDVWSDQNAFIKVDNTANDVTTSTGYPLLANNVIPVVVRQGAKIGAILAAGTGTLRYHKVG